MIETNLAQTVNATNDSGSVYDTNVKYLLSDKRFLSTLRRRSQRIPANWDTTWRIGLYSILQG